MQRSMYHSAARSFPPMYRWPRPLKIAIVGAGALVCLAAYAALLSGIFSLLSLLLAEA
jgi:hypothetical protein